ncbi:MAG: putative metal-dependent hydrolase [Flavobacteriaceae bacterium]|jgi:hypothetical protein|nr:putative metal-dependent hydrolase [Flavobacteriaceae bacterium]
MTEDALEKLKYPIGRYQRTPFHEDEVQANIQTIAKFPALLRSRVEKLSPDDLLKSYRPGGWSIAQIVHHMADSHMHSYMRFKHAVLENHPTIKDYEEADWAQLEDAKTIAIRHSLDLLEALHHRWVIFLESLSERDFYKAYYHSGYKKDYPLHIALGVYAWHGKHHLAHIQNALKK